MKSLNTEVLIIGGGIVGTSAALVLAKAGRRVTLLERDLCGARSSGINYGGVRRQGGPKCSCRCRSGPMRSGAICSH
jgi:sarcosine oxidase subunit beta